MSWKAHWGTNLLYASLDTLAATVRIGMYKPKSRRCRRWRPRRCYSWKKRSSLSDVPGSTDAGGTRLRCREFEERTYQHTHYRSFTVEIWTTHPLRSRSLFNHSHDYINQRRSGGLVRGLCPNETKNYCDGRPQARDPGQASIFEDNLPSSD